MFLSLHILGIGDGGITIEIHVVQSGETLGSIAERYGVSLSSVFQVNQLSSSNIVPNQAILIPTDRMSYIVMPGDTLGSIADRYALSLNAIQELNPKIRVNTIRVGDILRLPPSGRSSITVLGFLELTGTADDRTYVQSHAPYNTYMAMFGYGMQENGWIYPVSDRVALESVGQSHATPTAVFSNWVGTEFSQTAVHAMLSNASVRSQYISEVVKVVTNKGYRAVVIDFENIAPEDSEQFTNFLSELSAQLLPLFIRLFVSVMPITGAKDATNPLLSPYDYTNVAEHAVQLILMAYNWHWATGAPGPIAPFSDVENTIRYALSVVPRVQIFLGIIRYGYDWVLPYHSNESATVVSAQDAISMAMRRGSFINFDTASMTPWFRYWDSSGVEHVVWFEDIRSVQVKLQLAKKYNLAGLAQWELSQTFPQMTPLLLNNFQIM